MINVFTTVESHKCFYEVKINCESLEFCLFNYFFFNMTITELNIMYFFLFAVVGSVITGSFSKLREYILIY